jgi:hypothetical protein
MVGRCVTAGSRELEQSVECRRHLDQLGLRGAAAAHRNDDDVALAGQHACELAGERCLADAFPRADNRERRKGERLVARGLEVEVGADVAQSERE